MRSRFVDHVNGLRMHVLEAGDPADPVIVLLHGFPELAFSWRSVMPALAAAGYHVVAPDQRGFGRTTGWDDRYDGLSNTLEVHVVELRRKLEARGPRLIQTVRGRGYLFGEPVGGSGP